MTGTTDAAAAAAVAAAATQSAPDTADRRRPGRAQAANPWLIPLMRGETADWMASAREDRADRDRLDQPGLSPFAFRGIAIAILFAIALWSAVALFIDWVVKIN